MPARIALTKQTAIEFYKYEGQHRNEWPAWSQVFNVLGERHIGKIATKAAETLEPLRLEIAIAKWPAEFRVIMWEAVAATATKLAAESKIGGQDE